MTGVDASDLTVPIGIREHLSKIWSLLHSNFTFLIRDYLLPKAWETSLHVEFDKDTKCVVVHMHLDLISVPTQKIFP